jgi:hypothetical protein
MRHLARNCQKTDIPHSFFYLPQDLLDSCKKLFEDLLWEHRDLTEAFAALQLTHSQCQGLFELTGFFCTDFSFDEFY